MDTMVIPPEHRLTRAGPGPIQRLAIQPSRRGAGLWLAIAVGAALFAVGCSRSSDQLGASDTSSSATLATGSSAATAASSDAAAPPAVPEQCGERAGVAIFHSPRQPRPGVPLRVVVVSDEPLTGAGKDAVAVSGPDGKPLAGTIEEGGGPPFWWLWRVKDPPEGKLQVQFRAPATHVCLDVDVAKGRTAAPRVKWGTVWRVTTAWDRDLENFYSAWIDRLFDAPLDEQPTWPILHEVLRDPARNVLYGHLGLREDDPKHRPPRIDPDCADLPYYLRAYFAFKLGLPFGYSACTRATASGPPRCVKLSTNLRVRKLERKGYVRRFGEFLAIKVANRVHSSSVRTLGEDDATDVYPIRLTPQSLRPGAVFADPYGHALIVVRRVPQTDTQAGIMFAVDGQPDGTVSRRRYWRGNFLFSDDARLGGPGFKRFRPVVAEGGRLRTLSNDEILAHPDYGDFSLQQYQNGIEGFYDAVDDVLSPAPLDPAQAFAAILVAFQEQVERRVLSVQNAVDFVKGKRARIDMPTGAKIFQTQGPWEDYSTPSRDMRLLIAMDIVRGFPARVERRSSRYAMPTGKSPAEVRAALEARLTSETTSRRFSYTRSDGSKFELSLADVLARSESFEMAYNPNDCPEKRWAAPAGSKELSTCARHATADQVALMREYRQWFATRQRPAH